MKEVLGAEIDFRCQVSGVGASTPQADVRCPMSEIGSQMSDDRRQMVDIR